MNPEYWQKVKIIIEEALELAPEQRPDYLMEACGDDPALRREVDLLLSFEDENLELIERDFVSAVLDKEPAESAKNIIGRHIGSYKIIGELGAGGMGTVFLAERADGAFEQQVALKLIKRGMDSNAILRRFFTERQILASLVHPNIGHLIDGGTTDDGLPFFVMEYVTGEPIDKYCERENLELGERLTLFRKVCGAVSFAHSNLVIHRDLKPSNILVTKDGTPKLLDFGIAKLLKADTGSSTTTQMPIFTPEYASPEQVRGEKLATATDVYSLGVILYELLTGNRPYQTANKNLSEIIRAVCETEPVRPSSVARERGGQWRESEAVSGKSTDKDRNPKTEDQNRNPQSAIRNPKSLRGDLDNIILKALRKEPDRRYSSVEQFSEDIHRHQAGLPITAAKDTWDYRAAKFVQRNRISIIAAGLILLTLLGGLAATLYQANVARRERAKAEQRFNDVRQMANSFMFEIHDAIQSLSGATPARKLVVSRAIEYLDKLAAESTNDPALQRELGTAYEKIGKIQGNTYYSNLGDTDGAMKSYQRSLEIRQKLADSDPVNPDFQYELARAHRGVGDMLYTVDDLKGGLQSYENGVNILEKIVAAHPENQEYLSVLVDTLSRCGDIKGMEGFPNLGDPKGALENYRRVVVLAEKLVAAVPDNVEHQGDYATRLIYLGKLQSATGDANGAIASGEKATALLEKLLAANPAEVGYKTRLMIALNVMRGPLLDEGRTAEAVESARHVVKTLEGMIAEDPKNTQLRRGLGVSYNSLGTSFLQAKDIKSAVESFRHALAIAEELTAADPKNAENRRDILVTKQLLAEAQIENREYDAALLNLRQNAGNLEETLKADNSNNQAKNDLAVCLFLTAKGLAAKGDLAGAAEIYRRGGLLATEDLQKASLNTRAKSKYAVAFFEAGKTLAKLPKAEGRGDSPNEVCNYFKRSLELWNEMRQAGTLSAINANRPDEVTKELAGCN